MATARMPDSLNRSGTTGSVSLAQMRAANVRIEWFEAVAVAAALCQSIVESADERAPLTADNVFIFGDGTVSAMVGVHAPGELVRGVAALLGDLLPDFHRRVSFHELLTTASATPPGYPTLEQLARALAPFERPGRDGIIRELYSRGAASVSTSAPVYTASFEPAALDRFVSERALRPDGPAADPLPFSTPAAAARPTPQTPRPAARTSKSPSQNPKIQLAVMAVVAVLAIGIGARVIWTMWPRHAAPSTVQQSAPAAPAQDTAAAAADAPTETTATQSSTPSQTQSGAQATGSPSAASNNPSTGAGSGAGTGNSAFVGPMPPFSSGPATATARATPRASSPSSIQPRASAPTQPPVDAGSRTAVSAAPAGRGPSGTNAPTDTAGGRPTASASTPPRTVAAAPDGMAADADHVYNAGDRDVTPPMLPASQQLWRIPASPRPQDTIQVEIIVDEQGNVESARAVGVPTSLSDATAVAMSLSAAKSWRFRPATKDGQPVKYKQTVAVTIR